MKWSKEDMQAVLYDCRNNKLKPTAAAKKYKIPRTTLTDRLDKRDSRK